MRTKTILSAIPIYIAAAVWIVWGLFQPLYSGLSIALCALISAAAYFVSSRIFKGRVIEVEAAPDTGDAALNKQILEGRRAIRALREANDAIPSPVVSAQLDRMESAGYKIFDEIEKSHQKADEVRKFMNYYLPTSVKLLNHYKTLKDTGLEGEHIKKSMNSIENSLEMIASAFEKQLDNLYRAEALDITTDIQVLETMMVGEGLTEDIIQKSNKPQGGNRNV